MGPPFIYWHFPVLECLYELRMRELSFEYSKFKFTAIKQKKHILNIYILCMKIVSSKDDNDS